jgi:hypothetical protein
VTRVRPPGDVAERLGLDVETDEVVLPAVGFLGTLLIFTPWKSATEILSWNGLAILAAAASYGVSHVYMGRFLAGRGIPPLTLAASQLQPQPCYWLS